MSHLVATFSVGDHQDNHGIYAFSLKCFIILPNWSFKAVWARTHAHSVTWGHWLSMYIKYANKKKYQREKISWPSEWPIIGCYKKSHQACDWSIYCLSLTPEHHGFVRELTWTSFQSWVLVDWNSGIWQHCSQPKKHMIMLAWVPVANIKLPRIRCFRWWSSRDAEFILQQYLYH